MFEARVIAGFFLGARLASTELSRDRIALMTTNFDLWTFELLRNGLALTPDWRVLELASVLERELNALLLINVRSISLHVAFVRINSDPRPIAATTKGRMSRNRNGRPSPENQRCHS